MKRTWEWLGEVLLHLGLLIATIAFGIFSLFTFVMIERNKNKRSGRRGGIYYYEPRDWLRRMEVAMSGLFLLLGIVQTVRFFKKLFRERR